MRVSKAAGFLVALALLPPSLAEAQPRDILGVRVASLSIDGPHQVDPETTSVRLAGTALTALDLPAPAQTITVTRDGEPIGTTTTGIDGAWEMTLSVSEHMHRFEAHWDLLEVSSEAHFTYIPNPFELALSLDHARSITDTIDEDGGSLVGTNQQGDVFRLTIPAGALLGPQEITMIPLAEITAGPVGSGFGVQLEPDGLGFTTPATLTMEPVMQGEVFLPLAWSEDGQDPHLIAPQPGTSEIRITHFSGYAGFASPQAVLDSIRTMHANAYAGFLEELIAEALIRNSLLPFEEQLDPDEILAPLVEAYYHDILMPLLDAATRDDRHFPHAITKVFRWTMWKQLTNTEDRFATETARMETVLKQAIEFAYDESHRRCTQDHNVVALKAMVMLLKLRDLFNFVPDMDEGKIRACARFELDLSTTITIYFSDGSTTSKVKVDSLPLELSTPVGNCFSNGGCVAPLQYESFTANFPHVCGTTTTVEEPMEIQGLYMTMNITGSYIAHEKMAPNIILDPLSFGSARETVRFCPPPPDSPYEVELQMYPIAMLIAYSSGEEGITRWNYTGDANFANKTVLRQVAGGFDVHEFSRWTLRHTPRAA
jgi:hypothetical protein